MAKNQPVLEKVLGRIKLTIWKNPGGQNVEHFYSTRIVRLFKDDNEKWQETNSFNLDDLPIVARLAERSFDYIHEMQARERAHRREEQKRQQQSGGEHATDVAF